MRKYYEAGFKGAPQTQTEINYLYVDGIVYDSPTLPSKDAAYLWMSREKYDPGAYGEEHQKTGDCTSHGTRSTIDTVRCVEMDIKGEAEMYVARCATEPIYGMRGHRGMGMSPALATRFVTEKGFAIRKKYGSIDLSGYRPDLASRWGARGTPTSIQDACAEHPIGSFSVPKSLEDAQGLFSNGYACHSGQLLGLTTTADCNGLNMPTNRPWNHDMCTVGFDRSKKYWRDSVFFVVNSWSAWNKTWEGWPKELGPPIVGMAVVRADVWERYMLRSTAYFYSDVKGFPTKEIPNYGTSTFL